MTFCRDCAHITSFSGQPWKIGMYAYCSAVPDVVTGSMALCEAARSGECGMDAKMYRPRLAVAVEAPSDGRA